MKKYLLAIALMMPLVIMAQEEKSSSKTVEFLSKDGTFLLKEFFDLPTIGSSYNTVDFQVLIITDLKSDGKIGCLRLTTHYPSRSGNDDYIGTLDPDEIDACVMCLEKIKTDISPTAPTIYTEVEYKTRDGVKIGSFWREKKSEWVIYVQTKSYTSRSTTSLNTTSLPSLISNLKEAKELIATKCN